MSANWAEGALDKEKKRPIIRRKNFGKLNLPRKGAEREKPELSAYRKGERISPRKKKGPPSTEIKSADFFRKEERASSNKNQESTGKAAARTTRKANSYKKKKGSLFDPKEVLSPAVAERSVKKSVRERSSDGKE